MLGNDVSHLLKKSKSGDQILDFPHLDHEEQLLEIGILSSSLHVPLHI